MIGQGGDVVEMLKNTLSQKLIRNLFCKKLSVNINLQWHMYQGLVMSAYKVINCLISQPKHMFWVLKRTVSMRRFF